jgi:hypothetical protein
MAIKASARPSCAAARPRKRAGSSRLLQIDLFGDASPMPRMQIPAWQELSEATRGTLTHLRTLLILDHARTTGADAGMEADHDL